MLIKAKFHLLHLHIFLFRYSFAPENKRTHKHKSEGSVSFILSQPFSINISVLFRTERIGRLNVFLSN